MNNEAWNKAIALEMQAESVAIHPRKNTVLTFPRESPKKEHKGSVPNQVHRTPEAFA
jgi:hypothetical protein